MSKYAILTRRTSDADGLHYEVLDIVEKSQENDGRIKKLYEYALARRYAQRNVAYFVFGEFGIETRLGKTVPEIIAESRQALVNLIRRIAYEKASRVGWDDLKPSYVAMAAGVQLSGPVADCPRRG
jgi:hypothetical protein